MPRGIPNKKPENAGYDGEATVLTEETADNPAWGLVEESAKVWEAINGLLERVKRLETTGARHQPDDTPVRCTVCGATATPIHRRDRDGTFHDECPTCSSRHQVG